MYLVAGTVIAGVCVAILGDDADRYENKVITLAILIWPVMLVILIFGILTGIAIRIGKKIISFATKVHCNATWSVL